MDKKAVIFIVEDDPGFNMLMTNYLTGKNKWEVHTFESGEKCLEQLDLKPDIFLQDYDLPGINGVEVMKRVKQQLPGTEFIFLSAQTDIKVVVGALQLGAFDYIVKDAYAKENALNKIDQIVKISRFLQEQRENKKVNRILTILLIIVLISVALTWVPKIFH
jgi:Response regulator containing CheY-like receiver, AAA-type ATPase, and DNA-binding domains